MQRLVVYARTSTDDNQSPDDSLRWQKRMAVDLARDKAQIVRVVHDRDQSRSIPWTERPEASKLLAEMPNADRGWDGIILAEPQSAFGTADQFQYVSLLMQHYKVTLWVPEVGGEVDFTSEAHEIILNLFGTFAKGESARIKRRVTNGMRAMVGERFLGGRPPYGYRLVSTGVPHPNPEKAGWGAELQRLELDPETAPVVERIFQMRCEGVGYRRIAALLDASGIPSPSAHDAKRNPHRRQKCWSQSMVYALCRNPRYKGTEVWGRMERVTELRDPLNPSAGQVGVRRPRRDRSGVIEVPDAIPAIVSVEVWDRAQAMNRSHTKQPRTPRNSRTYPLAGIVVCAHCGRRMYGESTKDRHGNAHQRYICRLTTEYPGETDHPKKLTFAEG